MWLFSVGCKSRCDRFCEDLGRVVLGNNLGELRWYGGCQFTRGRPNGLLKVSQKTFTDYLMETFGAVTEKRISMPVGINMEELSSDEPVGTWPFRELNGDLMCLVTQTGGNEYCAGLREISWRSALVILVYVEGTTTETFQLHCNVVMSMGWL